MDGGEFGTEPESFSKGSFGVFDVTGSEERGTEVVVEIGGVRDGADTGAEGGDGVLGLDCGDLEVDLGLGGVQVESFGEGLEALGGVGEDERQAIVSTPVLGGSRAGFAVLGGGFFGLVGSAKGVGQV